MDTLIIIVLYRIRKSTINERLKTAKFLQFIHIKKPDDERNNEEVQDAFRCLQEREQR